MRNREPQEHKGKQYNLQRQKKKKRVKIYLHRFITVQLLTLYDISLMLSKIH